MAYIFERWNKKTPQEKTATPTTSEQSITPDGGKYLSKVTVGPIQTQEKTVAANGTYTPESGKFFSKINVEIPVYNGEVRS